MKSPRAASMAENDITQLPMLSSPQNPRVKAYVELRTDGNVRRARGCFLLEGRRAVDAALSLPRVRIEELIYSDHLLGEDLTLIDRARAKQVPLVRVSKDVYKKIADVMTPQGIAAIVRMPEWKLDDLLNTPGALMVAACGMQDPGNLGTLIRSCEAAGAAGLFVLEGSADPFNAKVVRATAGGLLALPIVRLKTDEFLKAMNSRSVRLIATSAQGGVRYKTFDWSHRPLVLCIGNEGEGLPYTIDEACAERVTIPMKGSAESLNASVAASILLFQANS